ncbi:MULTISPECIES: type II CAAX endopeptidase family protein [unclassified Bradyrhizobium]|uniref:CPBP family intramembrane glutamic endopeptidase n=1 Tax=unclassified Bradyrhizobium TaxID=2631580 RepID=UPI00247A0EBF|nr:MULTISPECIES: type II CAAX endopeptidase family protein [unclassified Bradyrhizobium]WGR74631.1 CPBP family intramembrane metalloprotease [Bradyrhizobium sp. ISRA426]WGR79466.1 CPBP family intramembrane metalloprotease [Bradyrhizobium sp. ISRA430]WGR89803.1 CPBP family intramembrane metalloprotease [Bradyrhizobium sp. ISRA432]
MDTLNPQHPPLIMSPADHKPRVWKFWGTALWGVLVFVAMFVGQVGAIVVLVALRGHPIDLASIELVGHEPQALALSVIMGLPATLAAVWLAVCLKRASFVDYLALRWPSWKQLLVGAIGLLLLVLAWETMSRALGREATPGFMTDLLKSGRDKGAAVLLLLAFSVAAPMSEEVLARGFLYRGWSASFLRVPGAIILSSLVWTVVHLQYDMYFLAEVFTIGVWFGYMRYRANSLWLTIVLHALNNMTAVVLTMWLGS